MSQFQLLYSNVLGVLYLFQGDLIQKVSIALYKDEFLWSFDFCIRGMLSYRCQVGKLLAVEQIKHWKQLGHSFNLRKALLYLFIVEEIVKYHKQLSQVDSLLVSIPFLG
jgi:hypothetical protein